MTRRGDERTGSTHVEHGERSTAELVRRYAQVFNDTIEGDTHTVSSPFGAWLLLALAAPTTKGDARTRLESILATDAEDAFTRAVELIATSHQAVSAVSALWHRSDLVLRQFETWASGLPDDIAHGPIPSQSAIDSWAREHTRSLIEHFPVGVNPDTLLVMATAVATRIRWAEPLIVVPSTMLRGPWAESVRTVLVAADSHTQLVVRTESAGDVAVHAAHANTPLTVVSVIAQPSVRPALVHRAASEVAGMLTGAPSTASARSLFDLPVGDGHAWTMTESQVPFTGSVREERITTVLPAWDSIASHDLHAKSGLGFREATTGLLSVLQTDSRYDVAARQAVRASFTAAGFDAAAITATALSLGTNKHRDDRRTTVRHATVLFNRPYAVVAIARNRRATPPWHGLPVFSAWVAEPTDAGDPYAELRAQRRDRKSSHRRRRSSQARST